MTLLGRLVDRAHGVQSALRPRVASRFEPASNEAPGMLGVEADDRFPVAPARPPTLDHHEPAVRATRDTTQPPREQPRQLDLRPPVRASAAPQDRKPPAVQPHEPPPTLQRKEPPPTSKQRDEELGQQPRSAVAAAVPMEPEASSPRVAASPPAQLVASVSYSGPAPRVDLPLAPSLPRPAPPDSVLAPATETQAARVESSSRADGIPLLLAAQQQTPDDLAPAAANRVAAQPTPTTSTERGEEFPRLVSPHVLVASRRDARPDDGPTHDTPTVHVHIGRLELRATAPVEPAPTVKPARAGLQLADYLRGTR
jgi:hypothetical protein